MGAGAASERGQGGTLSGCGEANHRKHFRWRDSQDKGLRWEQRGKEAGREDMMMEKGPEGWTRLDGMVSVTLGAVVVFPAGDGAVHSFAHRNLPSPSA